MEKEAIVITINKHNLYRGIRIALSLAVFLFLVMYCGTNMNMDFPMIRYICYILQEAEPP